jgi:2-oxoglutarate ferredoxin oxidoreductase subunit gamma
MTEKIIIAGAGGQGVMLLGKIIAEAAMRENKHVTWLPAYGAEVRGGASYCMVVISDQDIGSPIIDKASSLIIMNSPSFQKFHTKITKNGVCILNSSLVKDEIVLTSQAVSKIHYVQCPFTEIALELGNIKVANVVALGCYSAQNKVIEKETFLKVIEDIAPSDKKELIEINKQAFWKGSEASYG